MCCQIVGTLRRPTGATAPHYEGPATPARDRCHCTLSRKIWRRARAPDGREPMVNVYEALAMTVPGIIAHQSALKDGETLKVPQFDRPKA